jgi:hypothetical protein
MPQKAATALDRYGHVDEVAAWQDECLNQRTHSVHGPEEGGIPYRRRRYAPNGGAILLKSFIVRYRKPKGPSDSAPLISGT